MTGFAHAGSNTPRSKGSAGPIEANAWRASGVAALYSIAVLNGFAADIVEAIRAQPFWAALMSTFGISVVSVAAVACGIMLVLRSAGRAASRGDVVIALLVAALLLVPHRAGSWAALTVLALFEITRSRATDGDRIAAAIFLALAASEFWARIALQSLGNVMLSWDAALVAGLLSHFVTGEIVRSGNLIELPDGTSLALIVGCDSLTNIAYGILCWLVIAKGMRPHWISFDVFAIVAVAVGVVSLNTVRVALMAGDPQSYELVHGAVGADAFNLILLALSGAIALWTVRNTPQPLGDRSPAAGDLQHRR